MLSALHVAGCSDPFRSCLESRTCDEGGGAGMGGAAGFAGASSGTGGTAGLGGSPVESGGSPSMGEEAGAGGEPTAGGAASGGTSAAAGAADDGGEGGSPSVPCDATRSPLEEVCRVTEENAIFVAPEGDDTQEGTREAPLQSLTRAVQVAAETGKFVVACTGTFRENVLIENVTRAELYGGFNCSEGWTHGAAVTSVVPTLGVPLSINSVSGAAHVEGFAFRAPNGTAPGDSSLAASVVNSPDVTLRSVSLTAGNGATGAPGRTVPYTLPPATRLRGNAADAAGAGGGALCSFECPSEVSTVGGRGGDGDADGAGPRVPQPGEDGAPIYSASSTSGKGGTAAAACVGTLGLHGSGTDGADAPPADPGAGAKDWGVLDIRGWQPRAGAAGESGAPGQGGGGGRGGDAASATLAGGGGGGACGGCGGKGGAAGQGGGGSIALMIVSAGVLLEDAQLTTANGGKGGAGAAGQAGQSGGTAGQNAGTGCDGGSGGSGADGGKGGGGAGGISVGILFSGARPTTGAGVTFTLGNAGAGGIGAAAAPASNNGIDGVADRLLAL